MAKAAMSKDIQIERSSGNVFADLGLPNPEEHLVKATIALAIARTIRERGLTQEQAGEILGLTQPKVSDLVRGHLDKFTIDRLMRYMRKLDYDVTISFTPKPKSREEAAIHVKGASVPA
jgi:predicted XRE-type DNA-binding protein